MSQTKETDLLEGTVEPRTDVAVQQQAMSQDDAAANIAVQMATAAIEMSRRPSGEIDVEAVREIRGMAKELRDEGRLQWFARDMSSAQAEMQPVVRASEVNLGAGKGSYKHASLDDIDEMLRPIRTKYGFSITSDRIPRPGDGGGFVIISTLWHRSGHSITASFPLPLDSGPGRNNLQAAGSTDSYGRKYNALALFDIVRKNQDDDGKGGSQDLTEAQIAELESLIVETKTVRTAFFATMMTGKIEGWEDIDAVHFDRLKNALINKKRTMKKNEDV